MDRFNMIDNFYTEILFRSQPGNIEITINKNRIEKIIASSTFCFRHAESEYLVLFSVPNYSRMRRAYRIFRTVQASDISRSRDGSNVPPCRYNCL